MVRSFFKVDMVRSFNNCQAGKMMPLTMVQVYKKGGTNQNKSMEMTYEQMQKELGLGVQIE